MKKSILIIIITALFCSCSKDETLILSVNNLEFRPTGGEVKISVTANTGWDARIEVDWVTIETSGNMGNGFILVKVPLYYSFVGPYTERRTKITITTRSGGIIQEIGIVQKVDNLNQLYDRLEEPFAFHYSLIGSAHHARDPHTLFDLGAYNYVLYPDSPLKFYGEVIDGIVTLDFPNNQLESSFEYESFKDGFTTLFVTIVLQDNDGARIGLHKMGERVWPRSNDSYSVFMYYVRDDYPPFKSGWNFMEYYYNPDPLDGKPSEWIGGVISQDINDYFEMGYRWKFEFSWI
jgi:hypothetical protein